MQIDVNEKINVLSFVSTREREKSDNVVSNMQAVEVRRTLKGICALHGKTVTSVIFVTIVFGIVIDALLIKIISPKLLSSSSPSLSS